ncbi:hypothetical protein AB6A40_009392 [Gnathostoma spinigerum]|uniref:PHD-type domain-containing protein n=1 Tax=Gnathostoma spinigerum TaxID=75299 RepID=A0ABD6ES90_9BILA
MDGSNGKWKALSIDRGVFSPTICLASRIPDVIAPQTPHRSAFFKFQKPLLPKRHKVSLIMDDLSDDYDPVNSFEQLMELLRVKPKPEYEIDTPPSSPDSVFQEVLDFKIKNAPKMEEVPRTCWHCEALVQEAAVSQSMSRLGLTPKSDGDGDVSFCSMRCYFTFIANAQIALSTDDLMEAEQYADDATLAKLRQISADNFARSLHLGKVKSEICNVTQSKNEQGHFSGDLSLLAMNDNESRGSEKVIHMKELSILTDMTPEKSAEKKWKGHLWRQYDSSLVESFQRIVDQVRQRYMAIQLQSSERTKAVARSDDLRICAFCARKGDGDVEVCGRLLNADANVWVHVNCAMWSQEVKLLTV